MSIANRILVRPRPGRNRRRPSRMGPDLFRLALVFSLLASPVFAQQPQTDPPADQSAVNLFGFTFDQSERLRFGGELMAGWSHDGAQAALGFEKQGRVGWAILTVSGRVSDRVRYFVSVNPVS